MVDRKAVMFAIGLLVFGIAGLALPFSPALQTIPSFTDNKYVEALQASGAIAIVLSVILFYLAYKNRVF